MTKAHLVMRTVAEFPKQYDTTSCTEATKECTVAHGLGNSISWLTLSWLWHQAPSPSFVRRCPQIGDIVSEQGWAGTVSGCTWYEDCWKQLAVPPEMAAVAAILEGTVSIYAPAIWMISELCVCKHHPSGSSALAPHACKPSLVASRTVVPSLDTSSLFVFHVFPACVPCKRRCMHAFLRDNTRNVRDNTLQKVYT
eukprot:2346230-Amphidinium_carterae.1